METLKLFVELLPVNIIQGLIYALVALGIMIPLRILSFPDLTSEGSFPLGACVLAACLEGGMPPVQATLVAIFAGALAGVATASTHRWLHINTMLCGIIVLTILFSINVRIMGKPNVALFNHPNVFSLIFGDHATNQYNQILLLGTLLVLITGLLYVFFQTQVGMAMRAVGASVPMAKAQGIHVALHSVGTGARRRANGSWRILASAATRFCRCQPGLWRTDQRLGRGYFGRGIAG